MEYVKTNNCCKNNDILNYNKRMVVIRGMGLCDIRKIREDIYLFTDLSLGWYYNSTVIITNEGPIVIDVFSDEKMFNEVFDFIKEKGFDKPAAVIYTHWHSDHTTGNRIFGDRIIAHKSTAKHLEQLKMKLEKINRTDVIPLMPTELIEGSMELSIGGKTLELIHCPGHTYGSILVYDKDNRVLVAGDNLVSKEVVFCIPPVIPSDSDDTSPVYLEHMFKVIERLEVDTIIPGHGLMLNPREILDLNKERYYKCLNENLKSIE